jgi:hypothetical protein
VIGPDDHRSGHGGRLYEANSRGDGEKEIVHLVWEESVLGGCHGHREDREGDHGQNRIAMRQMGEFEPTRIC